MKIDFPKSVVITYRSNKTFDNKRFVDLIIVIRTEDSLERRADPAVYLVYVENRLILGPSTLLGARNVNKY